MTDTSIMPYGKHKGTAMINIPAKDLIWLYENNRCSQEVKEYILDNLEVLRLQVEQSKKLRR